MEQEQQSTEQEQSGQEGQDMAKAKAKAKAKKGKKAYKRLSAEKIEQRRLRVIQLLQMGKGTNEIKRITKKEFGNSISDGALTRIRKEMQASAKKVAKIREPRAEGNNAIVVHEGAGIAILVRNLLDEMRAMDVRYIEIDALTGEYHVHQVRVTKGVIE